MIQRIWNYLLFTFLLVVLLVEFTSGEESDVPDFPLPERFKVKQSVFGTVGKLIDEYDPLNLGEGTPDYPPPKILTSALAAAVTSKDYQLSQYASNNGLPRLLKTIAKLYSKFLNRTLDPDDNVLITVGATEALYDTFQTNTFAGQEWIVIEPFYNYYEPMIKAANGVARYIELKPTKFNGTITSADWTFDREEMASLFNKKTKGIVINTPQNPIGKMYSHEELSFIANLVKKWNAMVLCDEVYQFITFDDNEQIRIAALPGMFERTVTVGSAGKAFADTGYRIGWVYGGKQLIDNLKTVHEIDVMVAPTPIMNAIAVMLEKESEDYRNPKSFLESFRKATEAKRNKFAKFLSDFGMQPIIPQGGWYVSANWSLLSNDVNFNFMDDDDPSTSFVEWLIKEVNVAGIPLSGFYSENNIRAGANIIRFTIIKSEKLLEKVEKQMKKWKNKH